jgi:hypothetical protein
MTVFAYLWRVALALSLAAGVVGVPWASHHAAPWAASASPSLPDASRGHDHGTAAAHDAGEAPAPGDETGSAPHACVWCAVARAAVPEPLAVPTPAPSTWRGSIVVDVGVPSTGFLDAVRSRGPPPTA